MIAFANIEEAKSAVSQWNGDPYSVIHLGDRGNSVFSFLNSERKLQILRFTDPNFRSRRDVEAEIAFVNFLRGRGVAVAEALANRDGLFTLSHSCKTGELICSSIAYAPGIEVQRESSHWNNKLFREWGRNLAQIHNGAADYKPGPKEALRWQWNKEILLEKNFIPEEDEKSAEELAEVLHVMRAFPKDGLNYGLIHADHAPQNFRYQEESGKITSFDFGNCCYHWYLADLAISLSTVRRAPNREEIREALLAGYSEYRSLPTDYEAHLDYFIRLRVVYVYLSRLYLWSKNRTLEQERDLRLFKERVHEKKGW